MFDVEKISARRPKWTAAHFPDAAVEMPDAPRVADTAEANVNGIERRVRPINRDVGDESLQPERLSRDIVNARHIPRCAGARDAKDFTGACADKEARGGSKAKRVNAGAGWKLDA